MPKKYHLHELCKLSEFAIQLDETRSLSSVIKIDELQNEGRRWSRVVKHYLPLREPVRKYGNYCDFFMNSSIDNSNDCQMQTLDKQSNTGFAMG